jgi:CCR4-NOT transcription complex subunit 1
MAELTDKLAGTMLELGYSCCSDEIAFRAVLRQSPEVDAQSVAAVLGMMARTHSGLSTDQQGGWGSANATGPTWNVAVCVDVLASSVPGLDWRQVAELLDHDSFVVPDAQGFQLLASAYKRGAGEQIPIKALVGKRWHNMQGQLSILRQATAAPPEVSYARRCSTGRSSWGREIG